MKKLGFYSDDTPALAKRILLLGADVQQVADALDITMQTLKQWEKRYPEFAAALKEGGMVATSKVAEALFKRAVGYDYEEDRVVHTKDGVEVHRVTKHMPPDTKAALAYLYNRDPERWRERQMLVDSDGNDILKGLKLMFVEPKLIDITPEAGHAD